MRGEDVDGYTKKKIKSFNISNSKIDCCVAHIEEKIKVVMGTSSQYHNLLFYWHLN